MKKMTIICFGKTADKNISNLIDHYLKKLKPMLQIDFKELKEAKTSNIQVKLKNELELIEKNIPKSSHIFVLDEKGKEFTSTTFSEKIESIVLNGKSHLCFVIGSAYGFHSTLYDNMNYELISLSKMTFTHDMIRVFLFEQLYRAEMIARNTGYHH